MDLVTLWLGVIAVTLLAVNVIVTVCIRKSCRLRELYEFPVAFGMISAFILPPFLLAAGCAIFETALAWVIVNQVVVFFTLAANALGRLRLR